MQETVDQVSRALGHWKLAHRVFIQPPRRNLVRFGDLHKIRIVAQIRLSIIALIKKLLPLPHHAQIFVVDDHHLHRQAETMDRGQLLNVHLKSTVTGNAKHASLGLGQLYAHSRWQSEAHGTQSAGSDKAAWRRRTITLCGPHLVLADIGDYDTVLRQAAEKFVEKANRGLRRPWWIWPRALGSESHVAPLVPVRQGRSRIPHGLVERGNRLGQVSHDGNFASAHAIQLRGIDFKVNDLGEGREAGWIAGDAII